MTLASWSECLFANRADFTALSSFTAEASLLAGQNAQPTIPFNTFGNPNHFGRALLFEASGVLSTTGTPTYQFTVRLSPTQGSATLSGGVLGITEAITTASGVTNVPWHLRLHCHCGTPGQGTTNATLICVGEVWGGTAFASPFRYALQPSTPESATWTRTFDGGLVNYLNLSATCSASSASNAITCKLARAYLLL